MALSTPALANSLEYKPDLGPLATLLERIREKYNPRQIWLFGSRARGDARPDSDWDLVVVVPDETPESELSPKAIWELRRDTGVYADIIPCPVTEFEEDWDTVNTISHVVAREGRLIYER